MNSKKCLVYTLKVANELVNRGFQIIDTSINIQKPQYKVFWFADSPEIREAITEITKK